MTETEPCVLKMGHTCCIIRWVGRERQREQDRGTEMQGDRVRERERERANGAIVKFAGTEFKRYFRVNLDLGRPQCIG